MLRPGAATAASPPLWLLLLRAHAPPPQSSGDRTPPHQDLAWAHRPLAHTAAGHVVSLMINGRQTASKQQANSTTVSLESLPGYTYPPTRCCRNKVHNPPDAASHQVPRPPAHLAAADSHCQAEATCMMCHAVISTSNSEPRHPGTPDQCPPPHTLPPEHTHCAACHAI